MTTFVPEHTTFRRLLLGAALIAVWWLAAWYLLISVDGDFLVVVLALAFAFGVVGAHLIRSGWSCLIAPLALLSPAFALVAFESSSVSNWLLNGAYILLHYTWFICSPAAIGAFVGWSSQQPRGREIA